MMMLGLGLQLGSSAAGVRSITATNTIDGAAVSPVTLTLSWPDGVTPSSVAEQPARGVLAVSAGNVTFDPDGDFAAQLNTITTKEVGKVLASDGRTYSVNVRVFGEATLALEWRAADMPAEGTTLTAGGTVTFRLGEDVVPFTVATGTTVVFPTSPSGERLVRFPAAMGQIVDAESGNTRIGLVGTAPGEISAVRWQDGTPVASDAADISSSDSAFFKAAFATNTSNALGRLQDAAATDFDLSLDLSAVSGNVSTFRLGGALERSPETALPVKGVGLGGITARVAPDGSVTMAVSTTNPATVILADRLDASDLPTLLANAPAASTTPVIDVAALETAIGSPGVGVELTVDLDTVTSGGVAPITHTTDTGSIT